MCVKSDIELRAILPVIRYLGRIWSLALHPNRNREKALNKRLILAAKVVIAVLVAIFIIKAVLTAREEFAANRFQLNQVRWMWLVAAGFIYLLGLLPMGLYWYCVLRALGQKPYLTEILRAYYVGHLGKYVPGKAMVVYLRTDLIRSGRVDTALAAVSVFAETLTMMAVGAAISALIIAIQFWERKDMVLIAIGLMLAAGVPTLPPIFRRLVAFIQKKRGIDAIPLDGISWKLMSIGWLLSGLSWFVLGFSLWATLRAIPLDGTSIGPLEQLPRLTACVSLSMVAGFLSMIPGGAGVREWAQYELLSEPFGKVIAIVSAVLLRVAWLVSEVLISIILYLSLRKHR